MVMLRQVDTALILEVEDEDIAGEVVARYLRREGFGVRMAGHGAAALAAAADELPLLVVLDLMLPDMDGLKVCRRPRARRDPFPSSSSPPRARRAMRSWARC